jgi:putative nucleotidyltransferase with HDIG domain
MRSDDVATPRFGDLLSVLESMRSLADADDMADALSRFARELTLLMRASGCLVSSYDPGTEMVTDWAAYVVPPAQLNVVAESYSLERYPVTARVLRTLGEATSVVGAGADPAEEAFLVESGFAASLMVPLVIADQPVGLVEVFDTRPRRFDESECRHVRLLADHAGLVLRNARMAEDLERQHLATVAALAAALEAKDAYTGNHAQTIADLAVGVCEELGMAPSEIRAVRLGALLHDVGKIGIPESILNKPSRLTDDEFTVMKRHTVIGADIIAGIPGLTAVVALVRSSHERWDGRGYPDGLTGAEIHPGAAIIAVCDAFHAMTEDRVYRSAMSVEVAVAELRRCAGSQFMPAAVEALVAVLDRRGQRRVRFTPAAQAA